MNYTLFSSFKAFQSTHPIWIHPKVISTIQITVDAPYSCLPPNWTYGNQIEIGPDLCGLIFKKWVEYLESEGKTEFNLWLQNFGSGINGHPRLFYNQNDLGLIPEGCVNNFRTPFCANGIKECRKWIDNFIVSAGIDTIKKMTMIHEDCEVNILSYTGVGISPNPSETGWLHDSYLLDDRSETLFVDGIQTLKEFINTHLTSQEINLAKTVSSRWDVRLRPVHRALASLNSRIQRYALWKAYFQAFVEINPDITISNYQFSRPSKSIPNLDPNKPWMMVLDKDAPTLEQCEWYRKTCSSPVLYGVDYNEPGGSTEAFRNAGFYNFYGSRTATSNHYNHSLLSRECVLSYTDFGTIPWLTVDFNELTWNDFNEIHTHCIEMGSFRVPSINFWYPFNTVTATKQKEILDKLLVEINKN